MYITMSELFYFIISILIIGGLVILIPCLLKLLKILSNIDETLKQNKNNLNTTLSNIKDISVNVKDISNTATEVTADIILAKESINDKIHNTKEIVKIISDVFFRSNV